jgi:hypothetical protein
LALTDILADSSNVSAVIEVFTLFFIVAGFFRWYDSKYQKAIRETKNEVIDKMQDMQAVICDRLTRIDHELTRLDDRFHKHITDDDIHRHP